MKSIASVTFLALLAAYSHDASAQSRFSSTSPTGPQVSAPTVSAFPEGARVAFVDVDRVAAISAEGKAANAKLTELRAKKSAEVEARGKEVQALQAKLNQGASVLNDVARVRLERQFRRAQVDFQRFSEDAQAEVQEAQQETLQAFSAKLFPVIREVATEKKLWAVFGNESGLIWHDPATDLSEEVAKRLDAAAPKR